MRAKLPHPRKVGPTPVDRLKIEFEVTGVEDDPLRCVEGDGERVGHRVGDGDELHVTGPDAAPLAVVDRDELGAMTEPCLVDPVPRQADRELGPVNRDLQVTQQVGQPPGVVLVAVGEDDPVDLVGPLAEIGELGEHQIDPGHVGVGEHDPAVENDDATVDLDAGAVATDLTEPARGRRRVQGTPWGVISVFQATGWPVAIGGP